MTHEIPRAEGSKKEQTFLSQKKTKGADARTHLSWSVHLLTKFRQMQPFVLTANKEKKNILVHVNVSVSMNVFVWPHSVKRGQNDGANCANGTQFTGQEKSNHNQVYAYPLMSLSTEHFPNSLLSIILIKVYWVIRIWSNFTPKIRPNPKLFIYLKCPRWMFFCLCSFGYSLGTTVWSVRGVSQFQL